MKLTNAFEREFELRFLKSRGTAFQDFFSDLMEESYPGDFQRIRPHGPLGDLKCDGYLPSKKTVFQVYGPEDIHSVSKLLNKIQADFNGALQFWSGRMDHWVFVHNCPSGLPALAVQLLDELNNRPDGPTVEKWSYVELLHVARGKPTAQPLQKPSELKRFWLPYWTWLKDNLAPASSPSFGSRRSLGFPLKLVSANEADRINAHEKATIAEYRVRPETFSVASYLRGHSRDFENGTDLSQVLQNHLQLLIVGDAGSGKSTLLRRFAKNEAKRLCRRGISRARRRTPVLVELWRFSLNRPLVDLILGGIRRSGLKLSLEDLCMMMAQGYLSVLLDGLDEVPGQHRRECIAQILSLVEEYPELTLVVTTRPFPAPPNQFLELAIRPLEDSDVANAIAHQFNSKHAFKSQFHCLPEDYVRQLKPEILLLCRRPLTLRLVLTLLGDQGELPSTLNGVYDRFMSNLLDWEVKKGQLGSVVVAATLLEEMAYLMAKHDRRSIPLADVVREVGGNNQSLQVGHTDAEVVFGVIASTGLVTIVDGQVTFSHETFLEFLAARRILRGSIEPHEDPLAQRVGVARFLCGSIPNVAPLLEEMLKSCDDVESLMPVFEEASHNESDGGRFESFYRSISFARELASELNYSAPDCEPVIGKNIDELILAALELKPKGLTILKNAADGIIRGPIWSASQSWFSKVLEALETYNWPGVELHKRFAKILFDDDVVMFYGNEYGEYDTLFEYIEAVYKGDFDAALKHLEEVEGLYSKLRSKPPTPPLYRDLRHLVYPAQRELPKRMTDPILFLNQNQYGWLYGDHEGAEYEFVWLSSQQALFENVCDFVITTSELETDVTELEGFALTAARRSFESTGLSDDTLRLLLSNTSETAGLCWWGTFEQLKTSDDPWPRQVRYAFRNQGTEGPIQAREEFRFADYVTRHPFQWEFGPAISSRIRIRDF